MTIHWSVIPFADVMAGYEINQKETFEEVTMGHVTMVVIPESHGMGRIQRLISPVASDYLKSEWQPGCLIAMYTSQPLDMH